MTDKNFLNIHVLISHSPSCLNRDDMNMQKSAVFGGVRRVRISSQSLKRAMRTSDYYKQHFEKSTRTRIFVDRIVKELQNGVEDEKQLKEIETTGLFLAAIVEGKTKPDDIKKFKREKDKPIETQVIPFHSQEMERLKELLKEAVKQSESKRITFLKNECKKIENEEKSNISVDVALSGRMATSDLTYGIDGALSLAHTITTHQVDSEIDWFTAVDDLVEDSGDVGAGHLNTQEFGAGVFYRYASLNIGQLRKNLGGATRKEALKIAQHLIQMLATVVPTAKQHSHAAYNLADFVLVSFSDIPISAANAFEQPIRKSNKGFLRPSIEAFQKYWQNIQKGYGLDEKSAHFNLLKDENDSKKFDCYETLAELKTWIIS